ncbi:bifunctional hydroxymethylpyrimidine kinase/phosphomethylpyrimidine kinase [Candidatus Cyanaurora vandensis]|uniref:bifunctional hydroxymethylpyrimidine kinase/phosphomethylpyrimidine kinase n=1 Tax=Candidatus Cyanaurora vandensis TaxID=2714958 RepID=UPI00257A8F2D|nr:bifunctional hydroxymethylpyrimidine kinase/phosphomethylpyrimidine kinase [Candidatus Cyanaurora vandensis]
MTIARALTIAGSDSGGGAGIQADLKTFVCLGVHGMSALTCTTAQNTCGVRSTHSLPLDHIRDQIQMVVTDIGVDATKTGMLLNRVIIQTIALEIKTLGLTPLVVDPVMVSRTGARLLDEDATTAYQRTLFPLATLVTPNLYEAAILSGMTVQTLAEMGEAARRIHAQGPRYVLVKGGARAEHPGTDVFFDGITLTNFIIPNIITMNTHGTGCTLAAAITAYLSLGYPMVEAITQAKQFLDQALRHALAIGQGQGPVGHSFAQARPLPWKAL